MRPELVSAPLMVEGPVTFMVRELTVVMAPIVPPAMLTIPPALLVRVPISLKVLAPTFRTAPFPLEKLPLPADNGPVTVKVPGPRFAMLPLINPCALTVPVLVRPPAVTLSVPVVVSVPEFVKPVALVFQIPELTTMLALLASPFHVPKLLTVAPPVLLRRSPVQVPVAQLTTAAAGPVLLMAPRRWPLFLTVAELFESFFINTAPLPIPIPPHTLL